MFKAYNRDPPPKKKKKKRVGKLSGPYILHPKPKAPRLKDPNRTLTVWIPLREPLTGTLLRPHPLQYASLYRNPFKTLKSWSLLHPLKDDSAELHQHSRSEAHLLLRDFRV